MRSILIIDDDDQLRKSFQKLLAEEGYSVRNAPSGESGLAEIATEMPDLVVLDMRMPGMSGLETFQRIHAMESRLPVIIMTAFGTTDSAIEATKMGAFDYILKPFDIPELLAVIKKGVEAGRFMRSPVDMNVSDDKLNNFEREVIIGKSAPMQDVYKAIGRVSASDATVLVRGESGTGKELVARALYQHSLRGNKPFLVINCVAIPDTLLESELFGYEKGAFTGASHRRMGKIEQANGGTIFLDEIGDMPLGLQAKILRLLQEKSIERIGGRETIPVDVRIIAATNRNLEKAIKEGRFREDIYYRLKVVTVNLPPLRERNGDLPLLTDYFLSKYASEGNIKNPGITKDAQALLNSYSWPGNVRELANLLKKVLIFNRGTPVSCEELSSNLTQDSIAQNDELNSDIKDHVRMWIREQIQSDTSGNLFDRMIDSFATLLIGEALRFSSGNRSMAARKLGISRPTLHARIDKYNLKLETDVSSE